MIYMYMEMLSDVDLRGTIIMLILLLLGLLSVWHYNILNDEFGWGVKYK